jgi:cell division protein FtsB
VKESGLAAQMGPVARRLQLLCAEMTHEELEALRAEVRRLRAEVHSLNEEKAALEQRLAFLAQELAYTRTKVPPGTRTS